MPGRPDRRLGRLVRRAPQAAPVRRAARPEVLRLAFDAQRDYILDRSPRKLALCTRRAAKSTATALDFIDDGLDHPGEEFLIILGNRSDAKSVFYNKILGPLDRKLKLGSVFNSSEATMTLPGGAVIRLAGGEGGKARRILGNKLRAANIDEAQTFSPAALQELIYTTLLPALVDLKGRLSLTGTPCDQLVGEFFSLTKDICAGHMEQRQRSFHGWSRHSWSATDNPHVREQWLASIEEMKESFPGVEETPWFQQQYLGIWVTDLDARTYRFSFDRNTFDGTLPTFQDSSGGWHFVLGVDPGFHPDPAAFVLCAYNDFSASLWVIESWKQWRMDLTAMADKMDEFASRYHLDAIVIDPAAKQATEELRRRRGLPLTNATKQDKPGFIDVINAEFNAGRILIDVEACSQGVEDDSPREKRIDATLSLAQELLGDVWDAKALAAGKRIEHKAVPNDLCDAFNYAFRYCFPYLSRPERVSPGFGTPEWLAAQEDAMRALAEAEVQMRLGDDPEEARLAGFHGLPDADRERVVGALAAMDHAQDGGAEDDEPFLH